jgi:hypothetical protein
VDLIRSDSVIDAEDVLSSNIRKEAEEAPVTVEIPQDEISDIDVTENAVAEEFSVVDAEELTPVASVSSDDSTDDDDNNEEVA